MRVYFVPFRCSCNEIVLSCKIFVPINEVTIEDLIFSTVTVAVLVVMLIWVKKELSEAALSRKKISLVVLACRWFLSWTPLQLYLV